MPSGSHHSVAQSRKYLEALAFVGVWMASGWIFRLDANQYLLLGVPLVALFQLFVRRQPLRTLWVRDANSFQLSKMGFLLAALLMVAPAYRLCAVALPNKWWIGTLWCVCALAGAMAAAFALCRQRIAAARCALSSFITAILIGGAFTAAIALARHRSPALVISKTPFLLKWFLLYFAVTFVLEEVAFRGALDSHVYQPRNAASSASRWLSAIFVSALWGIWHLPFLPLPNAAVAAAAVPGVVLVHTLVGVPLSFCWRAGGTLVLSAAAHALIDSYRNAVLS